VVPVSEQGAVRFHERGEGAGRGRLIVDQGIVEIEKDRAHQPGFA
jgi:hypothetical protein